ncbi:uncharacterized protein N0V89_011089 [Didymosphaeria variabile]|uniref:Uncharacterized protein n=1 Tax=Didymosphaeria variabile TaxID=1932322 RepID=A0A9W9C6S2_9PLEO|nr:uncharacterized protein N0V89_011089 [Didymosphaeria variabile]KAJ4347151.1 hypothetical protein N0V89_011089 [Didymosphaeria variabile]
MAAPSEKTLQSLSGKWTLNKASSDDFIQILALQGVNILIRKAASAASVHQSITQPDPQHIEAVQSVTAGKIPGTTEKYILDWEWRSNNDPLFGEVQGRSRWLGGEQAKRLEIGDGEWIEGDSEGKIMHAQGKAANGKWEADHLWGFEIVDGERKHTRRARVKNDQGKELKVKMVYDFEG